MATQLRLVDPPAATPRTSRRASSRADAPTRTARVSAPGKKGSGRKGSGRRAVHWGEWQLDTRTRTIGRAGVAAARAALQQAAEQESLPRAS
jgi:hypothetical protein